MKVLPLLSLVVLVVACFVATSTTALGHSDAVRIRSALALSLSSWLWRCCMRSLSLQSAEKLVASHADGGGVF